MSTPGKKAGNNSHQYGCEISLPVHGNRWVISDIHGCINTFRALLSNIAPEGDDQLFLLGDYINKGPSSLEVLMEIINLKGNIYPLLGNHDKLFLDYFQNPSPEKEENLRQLNAGDLLDSDPETKAKIVQFLKDLPYYYLSGNMILVHAGFNFDLKDVFSDTESMITIKGFSYDPEKINGRSIVHGHYPTELNKIVAAVASDQPVIPLDNGCVYEGDKEGIGYLVGYELNRRVLMFQPNLDQT